ARKLRNVASCTSNHPRLPPDNPHVYSLGVSACSRVPERPEDDCLGAHGHRRYLFSTRLGKNQAAAHQQFRTYQQRKRTRGELSATQGPRGPIAIRGRKLKRNLPAAQPLVL
ncbi:unnamed protein product, partial [Ectocarpus sp. 12 AP-2014]